MAHSCKLGVDGEHPCPCGWFENQVAGLYRGGTGGDECERKRRRELLHRLAFERAPRVSRDAARKPLPHGQLRDRRQLADRGRGAIRSEAHTSELQSLMRNSYAVFCLKQKN